MNENLNKGTNKDHGSSSGKFVKGWVHPSGKVYVWNKMEPYHVQYIANNPSKFRLKEQDILDHLIERYEDYGVNQPATSARSEMINLKNGRTDIDRKVELMVIKKGWCRFVLDDDWGGLRGIKNKDIHKCAKILFDKMERRFTKSFGLEVNIIDARLGDYNYRKGKYLAHDMLRAWVNGKQPDPHSVQLRKHTEIGRTMKMFRGHDWDEPVKIYSSHIPLSFKEWLKESVEMKDGKYVTVKQFNSEDAAMASIENAEGLIDHMKIMDSVYTMVFDSEDHKEKFVKDHEFNLMGESTTHDSNSISEKSSRAEIEGAMEWWHGEITASSKRDRAAMGYGRPEHIRELIKRPVPNLKYHIKMYNAYLDEYGPFDEVPSRLEEARRFTPSGTFQFPSANQAKDFMSDISREGRGNIQTQHRFEQGYGRKNIIDVKWSGTMDRVVYDVLRKYNGRAWTQG